MFTQRTLASFPGLVCCNLHVANRQHAVMWYGNKLYAIVFHAKALLCFALVCCEIVFILMVATSPRMLHGVIVDLGTVPVTSIVVASRAVSSVITCPPITGDTRQRGIDTRQRHQGSFCLLNCLWQMFYTQYSTGKFHAVEWLGLKQERGSV